MHEATLTTQMPPIPGHVMVEIMTSKTKRKNTILTRVPLLPGSISLVKNMCKKIKHCSLYNAIDPCVLRVTLAQHYYYEKHKHCTIDKVGKLKC